MDTSVLQWRGEIQRANRPLIAHKRRNNPQKILYTGAVTSTRIVASVLFGRDEFTRTGTTEACRGIVVSGEWVEILPSKALIYGLEMLEITQAAVGPSLPIDGQCVTFYIDNNGSKCPVAKSDPKRLVVKISTRI